MKLRLRVQDEPWEVELRKDRRAPDGSRELELAVIEGPEPCRGRLLSVTLTARRGELWCFRVGGSVREVVVRRNGTAFEISPSTWAIPVQVGFHGAGFPSGEPAAAGRCQIRARMPGRVIRVLRSPGDRVEKGDGLAVIEAMKMQNELKAPRPGVVVYCGISDSQTVAAGELLFEVE